jgi:Lrp/AsnC family transcriptional regulator, leucine-responsive regulatory protein
MDDIDRSITRLLLANGRVSQEQLAREVHLSRPAVHERIKHLEEAGVLRGYKALVDWDALGLTMASFIWVRTSGTACRVAGQTFMQLHTATAIVEECHRVTGEWCMLLKVRVASPLALEQLLERIRDVTGVQDTMTILVLSTIAEDGRS